MGEAPGFLQLAIGATISDKLQKMLPPLHRRWTVEDLDAVMAAKIKENRFIEYKRELPSKDAEVKDLLADVSAFANSSGGTILYGIDEDQGEPVACPWYRER